jgi:hypothetical protein
MGDNYKKTNLQILIRSFLPLAVHGVRCLAGERADRDEYHQADRETKERVPSDPPALSRRIQGSGTVWAESDVISYSPRQSATNFILTALQHAPAQDRSYPALKRGGGRSTHPLSSPGTSCPSS